MQILANLEGLWLMPLECLHMTVLEIAHSQTEDEIAGLIKTMEGEIPNIANYTLQSHPRLVKPMLSYDAAAIALSFLPAAEGTVCGDSDHEKSAEKYTYHHLRRDIYAKSKSTGVDIASRYVVPSSHLTVARFVTQKDFAEADGGTDHAKIGALVAKIEAINSSLRAEYWPRQTSEWEVGEEKGLVCRRGTVWYGGGESHYEGQGFPSLIK